MNTAKTPFETPAAERRAKRLETLTEIGLGLARRLQQQAEEAPPGTLDVGAMALAYSRIARAVRQTIALAARLDAEAAAKTAKTRPDADIGLERPPIWDRGAPKPRPS